MYANGSTCVAGKGIEITASSDGGARSSIPAGTIELNGAGESDSDGHALTMVDGPVGAGVTGVTVIRSNASSVQATVQNGWYLAWWPGTERAVTPRVSDRERNQHAILPHRTTAAKPGLPLALGTKPRAGGQRVRYLSFGSVLDSSAAMMW